MRIGIIPITLAVLLPCYGQKSTEKTTSALGARLAQQYRKEMGIVPSPETNALQDYLQKIADRLSNALPTKHRYTVIYDCSPAFKSAFALPGNYIVVGGGILAIAEKEDEIASLLGHEIEHSELRQVERRTAELVHQRGSLDKVTIDDYYRHYTKTEELTCDREGVQLAQNAGYSPSGMLTLLQTFQAIRKGAPEKPSADAPTLAERIQQLNTLFADKQLRSGVSERPIAWP